MNFRRNDKILARIQRKLKNKGEHETTRDDILDEMTQIQAELCRDYLALKVTENIVMIAGANTYEIEDDIFKVAEFIEQTSWPCRINLTTDSAVWAKWSRDDAITGDYPYKGFVWNKTLYLKPTPTVDGDLLPFFGYANPSKDLVVGADPEVSSEWDKALELGTIAEILGDKALKLEYQAEALKTSTQNQNETLEGVNRVESTTDELGF